MPTGRSNETLSIPASATAKSTQTLPVYSVRVGIHYRTASLPQPIP